MIRSARSAYHGFSISRSPASQRPSRRRAECVAGPDSPCARRNPSARTGLPARFAPAEPPCPRRRPRRFPPRFCKKIPRSLYPARRKTAGVAPSRPAKGGPPFGNGRSVAPKAQDLVRFFQLVLFKKKIPKHAERVRPLHSLSVSRAQRTQPGAKTQHSMLLDFRQKSRYHHFQNPAFPVSARAYQNTGG